MSKLNDILKDLDGRYPQHRRIASEEIKALMLEIIGEDIVALDHSDQKQWGKIYTADHQEKVDQHNALLADLRKKVQEL